MKNLPAYLLVTTMAFATLGCSKKTEETPAPAPAPTKTQLLTGKNWIVTAETVSPGLPIGTNGALVTDLYAGNTPCQNDDFIRFETPNVFTEDEGAVKCRSSSPQTQTGTWAFNSAETVLTVTDGGFSPHTSTYNVVELTATSLKVTAVEALQGVNYTFSVTYRKG